MRKLSLLFFIMFIFVLSACSSNVNKNSEVLKVDGLKDQVKIYLDKYGIYHIYAKNDDDLFFAQGYVEAKSRLFFMDMLRNIGKGELGSMIGNIIPQVTEFDRFMKAINISLEDGKPIVQKVYDASPELVKKEMDSFTAGINYFINQIRSGKEKLPEMYSYYALKKDFLLDWQPTDTFLIGRLAQFALGGLRNTTWKINRALWEDKLPSDIEKDWVVTKVPTTTSILFGKSSVNSSSMKYENMGKYSDKIVKMRDFLSQLFDVLGVTKNVGSNNWVFSGSITKNGNSILANDPHLPLLTPPVWQGFHLDSKTYGTGKVKMTGYVISGIPLIMIGFNEHLGWGVTMTGYDVSDVYLQHIYKKDGKYYAKKIDGDVEVQVKYEKYRVRVDDNKWEERNLPVYYLKDDSALIIWDGMVNNPIYSNPTTGNAISFRWPGMDISREMETYYYLITASTVDDFYYALKFFGVGAQNFVMTNVHGDIAYDPHAMVPIRAPGARPWRLMDGYSNEGRWVGYLPDDKLPKLANPARGYISTANNDIFGILQKEVPPSSFDPYYYTSKWPGFRAERIDDLINEGKKNNELSVEYVEKMQRDSVTYYGKFFAPYIVTAATENPELLFTQDISGTEKEENYRKALNYIKNWTYHAYSGIDHGSVTYTKEQIPDSIATTIFEEWMRKLKENIYSDESEYYNVPMPENGLPCTAIKSMYHILHDPKDKIYAYSVTVGGSKLFDNILTPEIETKN